jgi:hypothetical protein
METGYKFFTSFWQGTERSWKKSPTIGWGGANALTPQPPLRHGRGTEEMGEMEVDIHCNIESTPEDQGLPPGETWSAKDLEEKGMDPSHSETKKRAR